jgi:ABC-2 type transport system ATP-binding protein
MKIEFNGVSRWYGQVIALTDVTTTLQPGVTGLLGQNGAGKSTLLNMATGLLKPSRGSVKLNGESIFGNISVLPKVGFCPEGDSFYEDATVTEFVVTMGLLSGMQKSVARKSLKSWLDRFQLTNKANERMGTLSKGQRQKIKIIQALIHDPQVVIFDEPLDGLDPLSRAEVTDLIYELGEQQKTVLVSSHILHEVEAFADNILVIHKGRLRAVGGIQEIRAQIDAHPHRIEVECKAPRAFAARAIQAAHIESVAISGNRVILETKDPDACYDAIPKIAEAENETVSALISLDNNLEAVFSYLVDA